MFASLSNFFAAEENDILTNTLSLSQYPVWLWVMSDDRCSYAGSGVRFNFFFSSCDWFFFSYLTIIWQLASRFERVPSLSGFWVLPSSCRVFIFPEGEVQSVATKTLCLLWPTLLSVLMPAYRDEVPASCIPLLHHPSPACPLFPPFYRCGLSVKNYYRWSTFVCLADRAKPRQEGTVGSQRSISDMKARNVFKIVMWQGFTCLVLWNWTMVRVRPSVWVRGRYRVPSVLRGLQTMWYWASGSPSLVQL